MRSYTESPWSIKFKEGEPLGRSFGQTNFLMGVLR
jgi:hypothetical protein